MALRDQTISIEAGATIQVFVDADYLRIKKSDVELRIKTARGDDFAITEGDEVNIANFAYVYITNTDVIDAVIDLYTGKNERVGSAKLSGNVTVSNLPDAGGVAVQSIEAVTNVSAVLVAANPARKYLLIQNKDLAGVIYLNVSGAATIANGLPLKPNDVYVFENFQMYNAIEAIGDIANNPNVLVIEA